MLDYFINFVIIFVNKNKYYSQILTIVLPPDDYFLIGLQVGTNFEWQESSLKVSLRAENLMNTTYRDYLNRLRYFADENGINVSLNLNYRF